MRTKESFLPGQQLLQNRLKKEGIKDSIIKGICESGYTLSEIDGSNLCVTDTFYGSKLGIGLIPLTVFLEYLCGKYYPAANIPIYKIRSIKEAQDILSSGRHIRFFQNGRMSFRGQVREHTAQRPCPNPFMRTISGNERLIIPSFWRSFNNNWNSRFDAIPPNTIFKSIKGDFLVYYGITNWQHILRSDPKGSSLQTMSDLENCSDPTSQEVFRRWQLFKVDYKLDSEFPLVEQHYGIDTCGLDITFDLGIAIFFAINNWQSKGEMASYEAVPNGEHKGLVYAFVFQDPPLTATSDMVKKVHSFNHIPPIRPVVQKCALPRFHSWNINEAAANLDAIFYINGRFDQLGISQARDLFPGKTRDPFYAAALEAKHKYPGLKPYSQFIEYDFD